jgi:hypothetical protein
MYVAKGEQIMRVRVYVATILVVLLTGLWLFSTDATADNSGQPETTCVNGAQVTVSAPFSYQGRLATEGNPANGEYDFAFAIYDQALHGSQLSQSHLCFTLTVVEGFFSIDLPFASELFSGGPRYLEIGVRPAASEVAYTFLFPRRQITASPYSIHADYAVQAGNATRLSGREPATFADKEHAHSTLAAPDGSNPHTLQVINGNTVNLNGALQINGLPPVRIIRFRNIGHETNLSTGVSAADYECAPTGWSTKYDVYESSAYTYMVWTFVHEGIWSVTVKFGSEDDDENPDVDILCFHKGLVSWEAGTPATDRSLWEPD